MGENAQDWIALTEKAIDLAKAIAHVGSESAGGIAVFLGTTRAERNRADAALVALDYEAYAEMAMAQLQALARRARERWPIVRLAMLHRTGRVEVGQPSVLIAVATPHRGDAFDACRFLIDSLKAEAAIWKKEVWSDATTSWVGA